MSILRETALILRNTLFVTVAVILGFTLGSALGVPVCLLPAALLFNRLSDGGPFAWGKALAFLIVVSGFLFALPHLPPSYRFPGIVLFLMFSPSVTKWFERCFGRTAPADAGSRSRSS